MEPGRKLDALVAEKVMGWTWKDYTAGGEPARGLFPPPPSGSFRDHDQYGYYSDDIAAAWELVEELEARGFVVRYQTMGPKRIGRRVTIERPEESGAIYGTAEAPEAAHAICLASLEAVGVDVTETALVERAREAGL